jgi:Lon protease-like protein
VELRFDPALIRFSGELPLFPLPKVVLFPGARIPLHIFEPRYRKMVSDAEQGEGFIGLVLPKKASMADDSDDPELHSVACMGQIRNLQKLPDGRFLLQLVGLQRVRIQRELQRNTPYRMAQVELMPEVIQPLEVGRTQTCADDVIVKFNQILRALTEPPCSAFTIHRDASPGLLLDVISYYLPTDADLKQRLLERVDVLQRGRLLLEILKTLSLAINGTTDARVHLFPFPSRN